MATLRKRPTLQGFSLPEEEQQTTETAPVEETLETTSQKMFETFSHIVEEPPQIIAEIAPTEDPGPRFIETPTPTPVVTTQPVKSPVTPKRHPRNIPKFSRIK